ncbi:DedA family protein [Halorubrum salsamenti]|uniref:DedA family protein n=1 Tax=Halorubrum salsamenti TaxID=2583990 RepID=UPI0011AA9E03|nr:VTT domain-containing protein [Halorubrum salsamenti]
MFGSHAATALALVDSYGAVAVFVVFALEGALVGKVLPARTLFVAAVVAVGVEAVAVLPVFAAAVVGATVGQSAVFVAVRRFGADPASLPLVPVGEGRLDGASRWFDRWGLPAVAASNAVPGTRGWLAVPTAKASSVSAPRFAAASLVGSAAYVGALLAIGVAVALGFGGALGLLGAEELAAL